MAAAEYYSPRRIAHALGVSESSLKRWCDQGLIHTMRTAGGHRKLSGDDVIRFAREHGMTVASPEILGLPVCQSLTEQDLGRFPQILAGALIQGDELLCRQIVMQFHLGKHSIARICDEVIARAFSEIGDLWSCQRADPYQERRACEITLRILSEIHRVQEPPSGKFLACGCTAEGDPYVLPTTMAEIVLREIGFQATNLGASLPFKSMSMAIRDIRPALFWLSVSHIPHEQEFLDGFSQLTSTCEATGTVLVAGGRELTPSWREKLNEFTFTDSMQQLASFATSLQRFHRRNLTGKKARAKRNTSTPA